MASVQRERETTTYRTSAWLGIDALAADPGNIFKVSTELLTEPTLVPGSDYFFVSAADAAASNDIDYTFKSERTTLSSQTRDGNKWTTSTWYGTKTYYREIIKESDIKTTATHTIEADRPVSIEILGHSEASVVINSTGAGKVIVEGGIVNDTGLTKIVSGSTITATNEDSVVQGVRVELQAAGGIGSAERALTVDLIDQYKAGHGGVATVQTAYAQLKAKATTGDIRIHELSGDMSIDTVEAMAGNVTLTAEGGIVVADHAAGQFRTGLVRGNSITLDADFGAIGSDTHALLINSSASAEGLVNIEASGDIFVSETVGDLRLQKAESLGGGVTIEVQDGSLLDADSFVEKDLRAIEDLKDGVWGDLQLTSQGGSSTKAEEAVQNYENYKRGEYNAYWQIRSRIVDDAYVMSDAERAYYLTPGRYPTQQEAQAAIATIEQSRFLQYQALDGVYGVLGDVFRSDINAAYSQYWAYRTAGDTTNADYIDLAKMFGGLNEVSKNPAFKYLFATGTIASSLRGSVKVWTEQELINAFGAGITKKVTDTEVVIENSNIIGGNVTIKADVNIGNVQGETVIHFTPGVQKQLTDDERVALAAAERQDIVYLSEYEENLTVGFGTENGMGVIIRSGGWPAGAYEAGSFLYVAGNTQNVTEDNAYFIVHSVVGNKLYVNGIFDSESGEVEALTGLIAEAGRTVDLGEVIDNPMDAGVFETTYGDGEEVEVLIQQFRILPGHDYARSRRDGAGRCRPRSQNLHPWIDAQRVTRSRTWRRRGARAS